MRVNRERGLLPQGSDWLVLVAAENLLRQSRYVVNDHSTRGVFLHKRVYVVRRVEVALTFSHRQQGAIRFA